MRTRLPLILVALTAAIAAAAFLIPSILSMSQVRPEPDPGLEIGEAIDVLLDVDDGVIGKGDDFRYSIQIQYNQELISELDKTSLDESVSFRPFEIRSMQEREYAIPPYTRVFERTYHLQLIDGSVNQLYQFPTIMVRYKSSESGEFREKAVDARPVYVASRLPTDATGLEPRPFRGRIEDASRADIPRVLLALGAFLALAALTDLAWRAIPGWRAAKDQRRKVEGVDVISEAYRRLMSGLADGVEPDRSLHQAEHILRVVLARRESVAWLEEPDLQKLPEAVRQDVAEVFELSGAVDDDPAATGIRAREASTCLRRVLAHYWGDGEIESWAR
jgi:hypothetical protein